MSKRFNCTLNEEVLQQRLVIEIKDAAFYNNSPTIEYGMTERPILVMSMSSALLRSKCGALHVNLFCYFLDLGSITNTSMVDHI